MNCEDWRESVHEKDGISKDKEREWRFEAVSFMTYFGIFLNLPQKTIAKAIFFFHKMSTQISFKKFDRLLNGAVCIFLTSKLDDRPKILKETVRAFLYIFNIHKKQKTTSTTPKSTTSSSELVYEGLTKEGFQAFMLDIKTMNEYEEKFCTIESEILNYVGYNFDVELPYVYLDLIKSSPIIPDSTFLKIANNFINDSLRTLVCLYYEPKVIALAGLNLAQFYCNYKLPEIEPSKAWYKCFGDEVTMSIIEEATGQIMDIYKKEGASQTANK